MQAAPPSWRARATPSTNDTSMARISNTQAAGRKPNGRPIREKTYEVPRKRVICDNFPTENRAQAVFVSSRMDELAIERRACFQAIADEAHIPIVFELEPFRSNKL